MYITELFYHYGMKERENIPDDVFRFRQFEIRQTGAAMKVGTDGVLIGAWATHEKPIHVLDIGTGTGLIALMIAQRFPEAQVEAVEIDEETCQLAKHNFENSKWPHRITPHHSDFQTFAETSANQFDLIVSNPPFFVNSLKSPNPRRNLARHDERLPLNSLLWGIENLLTRKGSAHLVLPYSTIEVVENVLKTSSLHLSRYTIVRPLKSKPPHRILVSLVKIKTAPTFSELIIEKQRHTYSDDFSRLVADFYL